jgi:lysophospholipase L1-like esterase
LSRLRKRVVLAVASGVGLGVVGIGGVLAVEIVLALHRQYLPTEPPMRIGGVFGSSENPSLTFVVLGDSTAAGVGAGQPEKAYPTLLAERLASHGRRVRLLDLGVSGARVGDVLDSQVPEAIGAAPDLVFVGIGGNDVTHFTGLGAVRRDMAEILKRLRSSGATVVVAGAPDMRAPALLEPLRSLCGWRGRQVAAAIEAVARDQGVAVVPLAADTGRDFHDDPARYYSSDGFHPGPAGYVRWADAIDPVLERVLGQAVR